MNLGSGMEGSWRGRQIGKERQGSCWANNCDLLASAVHFETLHLLRKTEDSQLDFTEWFLSLKSVAEVLAGLGLVTILLAVLKRAAERRNWNDFKRRAQDWIDDLIEADEKHPKEFSDAEWQFEVERLLSDSNFGPLEIQQLLEIGVIIARGLAAERVFFKVD